MEAHTIMTNGALNLGVGRRLFIVVKNIAPGHRLRIAIVGPASSDGDMSEDVAECVFEMHRNQKLTEIETATLALAGGGS